MFPSSNPEYILDNLFKPKHIPVLKFRGIFMRKIMIFLLVSIVLSLVLLAGCKKTVITPVSETYCNNDSDCACGTHINTGECFYGNKAFVNVEKQCPDYCTGIAAMFETRCVDKECKKVKREIVPPAADCNTDSDCAPEQCCHATSCIPVSKKGVCNLLCTNICMPGTIDCGGSCLCQNNKCTAKLNNLTEQVTPPAQPQAECTTDSDCVPEECCHSATCIPASKKGVCNLACTADCQRQTMDCGGFCTCVNGKCAAELNDL
jgi:hypothetical protein